MFVPGAVVSRPYLRRQRRAVTRTSRNMSKFERLISRNLGSQVRPMRKTLLLAVAGAALMDIGSARAQSAYSYPWCALYGDRSGAQSCYFATRRQCEETLQGIGGVCIPSPYYRGGERRWRGRY
jgi:hypothetical protein